jgi:hypothetical protein
VGELVAECRKVLSAVLSSRLAAVIAGLLIVLVPTLFSVFTEWTQWAAWVRITVLVGWFAAAAVVVTATVRQSELVEGLVGEPLERRTEARSVATRWLLRSLLQPEPAGMPPIYELRLFLPDTGSGLLVAEYESPGSTPSEGWQPGQGATGTAWVTNSMVIARVPEVHDGSYGLSREQQERYADLAIVAANPVQNARARQIGVIAVSANEDDGYFATADGRLNLVALCDVVARVLIDIRRIEGD